MAPFIASSMSFYQTLFSWFPSLSLYLLQDSYKSENEESLDKVASEYSLFNQLYPPLALITSTDSFLLVE